MDLTTNRLRLVPQTVAEVRAMIDAMSPEDRAEVSPEWLAKLDQSDSAEWMLGYAAVDRETGTTVGHCGFKGPPVDGMVEIAYGFAPEHQGRGYATEAAGALVEHAFDRGAAPIVLAHTRPGPNASTRVLEKNGFQCLGEVIDPEDGLVWRWEKRTDADRDSNS